MVKACRIDWKTSNSVVIAGEVDENADLSSLTKARDQILYVDLSGVTRLNSSGLRLWIQTISKNKTQLVLRECSPSVVEQFSLVPEFIGPNGHVESFYARYNCDSCPEEELLRLQIGKNLSETRPDLPRELTHPCPACGDTMSLDQSPEVYLSFFKNGYKHGSQAS